ncbi:MAG: carboxypeptidase regulatory-like domain-containing protein [Planctomycetota bacterium]|nr:carboxypeptidase regulatory-like domain-containing protein [Planctomycetota bacterium]
MPLQARKSEERKRRRSPNEFVSIAFGFGIAAVFFIVGGLHFWPRGTDRDLKGIVPAETASRSPSAYVPPSTRQVRIIIKNVPTLPFPVERIASGPTPTTGSTQRAETAPPGPPERQAVSPVTLVGTIMSIENEQPVAGAAVQARAGSAEVETFSDTTGSFRLVGVPGDARSVSITITAPGYAPLSLDTPVYPDRSEAMETHVALVPVGTLVGSVLDSEGKPIQGAGVSVAPENATASETWAISAKNLTGADGAFAFANLSRIHAYTLSVSASGHSDWNRKGIRLVEFPAVTRIDVRMFRRGVLYGRVVGSAGTGLGGVRVVATHAQTKAVALAISEPDGKYRMENLSLGDYQVCANVPRMLPFQSTVTVEGVTALVISIERRGLIEGKCAAADGGSLPPKTVVQIGRVVGGASPDSGRSKVEQLFTRTYYTGGRPEAAAVGAVPANPADMSLHPQDSVVVNWNGQVLFDDLDEGDYHMIIAGDGFLIAEFGDIKVTFDEPASRTDFPIRRGTTLIGSVLNGDDGKPIKDAIVTLYESAAGGADPSYGRKLAEASTRADGRFIVDGLVPGKVLVLIAHNSFQANTTAVVLREGESVSQTQVYLKPAGAIEGVAVRPDGTPNPFACLLFTTQDGRSSFIVSADRDGKFALGPLKPGKYRVTDTGQEVEVTTGEPAKVRVQTKPVSTGDGE